MGYHPEKGFLQADWNGYNEAMVLLVLAMGSPTHPIPDNAWQAWCEGYEWDTFYGENHLNFDPLFGHQYSQMYIDFRGIQDDFMRTKGSDYFENSRKATLTNRAYCMDNPQGFKAYGEHCWGLTACDGPRDVDTLVDGQQRQFFSYRVKRCLCYTNRGRRYDCAHRSRWFYSFCTRGLLARIGKHVEYLLR
ncbi:MAG: glucoamylase family protein [Saprospiraceae bacterium]